MKNILLSVSYDGTDFSGYQRQDCKGVKNSLRTVQGELEIALEKLLKAPVTVYGSGRTDSGVHAVDQKINFYSPIDSIPPENYVRALNSFLPGDIRVLKSEEVEESFNSRKNATSRAYRYFISTGNSENAAMNRFSWHFPYTPNLENLNDMASVLKGELDCSSFASSEDESVSTNRYIDGASFFFEKNFPSGDDLLVFQIEANAFLWKMVRTLTGTFVMLDKAGKGRKDFIKILEAKDRTKAGFTAPPTGLFLYKIRFDGVRRHP